ncbi:MAG: LCP family protein [Clostridia bacterium]|nr:LCP family protein [Clostridia bacterium]
MRRKLLFGFAALLLVAAVGLLLFGDEYLPETISVAADNANATSFLPTREYNGVVYEGRPSSSLTTVLLIGYDHMDDGVIVEEQDGFTHGGQSDFLLLLVIDHENRQIRMLQFDRDTMADVKYYSKSGAYFGTRKMQICLAHAYGDTQELNNSNTIWTVERFLGIGGANDGAQIDWYIAMDITGIGCLNDLLGGVTVPINDDFSYYDPTMIKGTTMTLTGEQAHIYCRQRYFIGDQTNENRMARQRVYISAATQVLRKRIDENANFAKELLNGMGIIYDTSKTLDDSFGFTMTDYQGTPITDTPTHYLMTNQSLGAIVSLLAKVLDYEILPVENIPGTHQIGSNGYVEFVTAENAGLEWALDALYRPVN